MCFKYWRVELYFRVRDVGCCCFFRELVKIVEVFEGIFLSRESYRRYLEDVVASPEFDLFRIVKSFIANSVKW